MRGGTLLGLLALAACSGTPRTDPAPPREKPLAPSEPPTRAKNPNLSVAEQQAIALSGQHYQMALAYTHKGDFERAKVEARRAVQLRHDNLAARKLLNEILEIVAGPGAFRTAAEVELQQHLVGIEQAQIEIVKHLRDGERYYHARMYRLAQREFQDAELKILAMPTHVEARARLLPQSKRYRLKAKNALENERRVAEGPR